MAPQVPAWGKEKRLALGAFLAVSLQQARQRRSEARELLAQGVDPSAERIAAKQAQRVDGMTFEALAREWYAYNAPRWAESTAYKARLYMENDLRFALALIW